MSSSDPTPAWFRKSFNEDYRTIYSGRDHGQAEAEVALVARELAIRRGERVLDLCCGFGRHLDALADRRIAATGVDLSLSLLRQAGPAARGRVVCADMRRLPFADRAFPVVVNFFTSFGYFESDSENDLAAAEMGRVLDAGGRFSMDLMNPGPTLRRLEPRTERHAGGFDVVEVRRFDAERRRIEKHVTLSRAADGSPGAGGGEAKRRYIESVRLYEPHEIEAVLARAGLTVERMLGDFAGNPYGGESPRMIILGRKMA